MRHAAAIRTRLRSAFALAPLVLLLNVTHVASAAASDVEWRSAPRVEVSRFDKERPPLAHLQRWGRPRPHPPFGILFSRLRIRVTAVTASSISVAWSGWRGRAAAYRVFQDGVPVAWTSKDGYTFAGLSCEASYVLGVVAIRPHGRLPMAAVRIEARTAACPAPPDTAAPSSPGNVHIVATTADSITIAWDASKDDVGVAGYGVYNGVTRIDSTTATSYTFAKLACAAGYTFAVDAYDSAGNRSSAAGLDARTDDCRPPPDTEAPTVPGNLHAIGTTASSITIVWDRSTDNVAVAGYGVYNGVTRVDTTSGTSYTFEKLSCGAGYTLAVDAYDAAGNRSGTAALDATTEPCPIAEPPPIAGQGYRLVFRDEFNSLDRSIWDDHIWYDGPPRPAWTNFQYTANGVLHLVTSRNFSCGTDCNYPLNTITTQSSGLTFKQGYFEARIRYTDDDVAWPAFWLLSYAHATNPSYPSLNPSCATNAQPPAECYSGELDVLDNGGAPNELYVGLSRNSCNCYGVPNNLRPSANWFPQPSRLGGAWHTYAALWTDSIVSWYLDDRLLATVPVFDSTNQRMFLLLQNWAGSSARWGAPITQATPGVLDVEVDHVQVWQK